MLITVTRLLIALMTGGVLDAVPGCVVIVTLQPPAMLPVSPVPSSTTNKDQAPFGFWPMNAARFVAYGPVSAGAGITSPGS